MGRNGILPKKYFGYVHPKFRTPIFTIILTGIVSLFAIWPNLELIASVINFGALIAFSFVNLSVIAYFVFQQKRYKTARDVFKYVIMPSLGTLSTGILWSQLQSDALIWGIIWVAIGLVYMIFLTKFFRIKLKSFDAEQQENNDNQSPNVKTM